MAKRKPQGKPPQIVSQPWQEPKPREKELPWRVTIKQGDLVANEKFESRKAALEFRRSLMNGK